MCMKKFKKIFDIKLAIYSLIFWTVYVAILELTLFRWLLGMSYEDVMWARMIGTPFNFVIGGFYHTIYDYFNRGLGWSVAVSNYGAIGIIKLLVNIFIYSSKSFSGHHLVWTNVFIKASLVVIAGTLVAAYYKKLYYHFLKYIRLRSMKKHPGFQAMFH